MRGADVVSVHGEAAARGRRGGHDGLGGWLAGYVFWGFFCEGSGAAYARAGRDGGGAAHPHACAVGCGQRPRACWRVWDGASRTGRASHRPDSQSTMVPDRHRQARGLVSGRRLFPAAAAAGVRVRDGGHRRLPRGTARPPTPQAGPLATEMMENRSSLQTRDRVRRPPSPSRHALSTVPPSPPTLPPPAWLTPTSTRWPGRSRAPPSPPARRGTWAAARTAPPTRGGRRRGAPPAAPRRAARASRGPRRRGSPRG